MGEDTGRKTPKYEVLGPLDFLKSRNYEEGHCC